LTIRNLANGNAGRGDFVRPGHIFPLIARDGGVLMRSGHTEAVVDLCRLGGLEPVTAGRGVLVYLRDGADPARSRDLVDPVAGDALAHLCRDRRVRHRDQ
jgi:3,4-dihydroxy-2-butanone 4-phosphate synthase